MWCATAGLSFCSPGKADGKIDRLYRYFSTCGNTSIFVTALSTYYNIIWAMIVTIWQFFHKFCTLLSYAFKYSRHTQNNVIVRRLVPIIRKKQIVNQIVVIELSTADKIISSYSITISIFSQYSKKLYFRRIDGVVCGVPQDV